MLRVTLAVIWLFLGGFALVSAANADAQTTYDLRSAEFDLPAGWKLTNSRRNQEYDFVSPDGRYELWARWWFPDEPLLGYTDILHHETRQLAGQEALFIHRDSGGTRTLELAFLTKDAEGEMFLWQLHSSTSSLAEHKAMFDQLLSGLRMNGLGLKGQVPDAKAGAASPQIMPPKAVQSAPCNVAGFDCGRYPRPSNPVLWERCAASAQGQAAQSLTDAVLSRIAARRQSQKE